MEYMSPLFSHTTIPSALNWESLAGFLIVGVLPAVVQRCLFRHDSFFKLDIFRVDHFILTSLFGEGGMVVMSMVMLMLWIQHRIYMVNNLRSCWINFMGFLHDDAPPIATEGMNVGAGSKFTIKSETQKYLEI